jgi:hypothetical protein
MSVRLGLPAGCLLALLAGAAAGLAPPRGPRTLGSHAGGAGSVHYAPDGKLLASGGGDGLVRVWDPATRKQRHALKGPTGFTCAVCFSPDGKTLAAAGYDRPRKSGLIYRWDAASGKELPQLAGHPGGVRRMLFTPDGKGIVSAGFDGTVRLWNLADGKEVRRLRAGAGPVHGIALAADGRALATCGQRDGLRLWDLATGKESPLGRLTPDPTLAVALSRDGRLLASGDRSGVRLWETATGKEVAALQGHKGDLSFLIFSADGKRLYTSSYDHAVRVWEVCGGRLACTLAGHTNWVWGIALAPDEKALVSCSYDRRVLHWDLAGVAPAARAVPLPARQREACWADLASADAARAYRAVWALAADPAGTLPLLEKHLARRCAAGLLAPGRLAQLIADLDADEYEVREQASEALARAGRRVEPALERALLRPPSLEARRRLEHLLQRLRPGALPPEELTAIRAVHVLEYIGTPPARGLLRKLARQAAGLRLGEESALALVRLSRPAKVHP